VVDKIPGEVMSCDVTDQRPALGRKVKPL
jgi:hypothetical protein